MPEKLFMAFDISKDMLAFVHIEKAAGTTFIHILRSNFFMRYCDVKPLESKSEKLFSPNDFKKVITINPFVKCIAGHSINPTIKLLSVVPNIKYITILRNPIERFVSQYQYWVEGMGKKLTFEQFLKSGAANLQTKKIAGTANLSKAKKILTKSFFLVGIVEEFDQFLILLKNKMKPFDFEPMYEIKNFSNSKSPIKKKINRGIEDYYDDIIKVNLLDIDLYNFAKDYLLPKEKENYGKNFINDLNNFKSLPKKHFKDFKMYTDYFFRKCYYDPIFKIIRKKNGLPAKGSY